MEKKPAPTVCFIGVGNLLRGDDGLGNYIVNALEREGFPGVTVMTVHQLDPSLIEDLVHFDNVVIVDAAMTGEDVDFYLLEDDGAKAVVTSHHVNVYLLQTLARQLYNTQVCFYLCAVRGENFEIGECLSTAAQKNAGKAIERLTGWLQSVSG